MAIVAGDILLKFSVAAAAGNTTAGTAATSLGDQISTTTITDGALHNLFDAITGDENAASEAEYRCVFVHNNHATLTLFSTKMWLLSETAGGAAIAISADTTGITAKGAATAQAKTIADENTAPATQTFTSPTTKGTGITLGDIPAGSVIGVWVRRTASNGPALDADGVVLRIEGDTSE